MARVILSSGHTVGPLCGEAGAGVGAGVAQGVVGAGDEVDCCALICCQYLAKQISGRGTCLVQSTVARVVDDLKNAGIAREVAGRAQVVETEDAKTLCVDRGEIGPSVGFLGVEGGTKLPVAVRVRALDLRGESIDLDFWAGLAHADSRTTARRVDLLFIEETGGRRPLQDEVCGGSGGDGQGEECLTEHVVDCAIRRGVCEETGN